MVRVVVPGLEPAAPPARPCPGRGPRGPRRTSHDRRRLRRPEPRRRPPAPPPGVDAARPGEAGDLYRAARGGARVIGLVDGVFEDRPTVWHKEILWALDRGVRVLGAASLGALRAAECAPFGMEGVGGSSSAAATARSRTTASSRRARPARARLAAADRGAGQRSRHARRRRRGRACCRAAAGGALIARAAALPFRALTWPALARGPRAGRRARGSRPGCPRAASTSSAPTRWRCSTRSPRRRPASRRRPPPASASPRPATGGRRSPGSSGAARSRPRRRRCSTSCASTRRGSSGRWCAPSPAAPPPASRLEPRRRRGRAPRRAAPAPRPRHRGRFRAWLARCAAEPAALAAALAAEERLARGARAGDRPRSRRRCSTRCASTAASRRWRAAPPTSARASPAARRRAYRETELAGARRRALRPAAGLDRQRRPRPRRALARARGPPRAAPPARRRARLRPRAGRGRRLAMAFAEARARATSARPHLPAVAARRRRAAAGDDHPLAARRHRSGPGPSDRRMYTIDAPGKRPYGPERAAGRCRPGGGRSRRPVDAVGRRPVRPPRARPTRASARCTSTAASASRSTSGRATSGGGSTGTSRGTSRGSSWSRSAPGRTRTWATATSRSASGRCPAAAIADYALNFDVIGHEIGHALMMAFAGRFSPDQVTADYEALHEASADWAAMIASLHLDAGGRGAARDHARRPRHRQPAQPLRRALLDPADPPRQQQPDDVGLRRRLVERARPGAAADRRAVRRLRRGLQGDPRPRTAPSRAPSTTSPTWPSATRPGAAGSAPASSAPTPATRRASTTRCARPATIAATMMVGLWMRADPSGSGSATSARSSREVDFEQFGGGLRPIVAGSLARRGIGLVPPGPRLRPPGRTATCIRRGQCGSDEVTSACLIHLAFVGARQTCPRKTCSRSPPSACSAA